MAKSWNSDGNPAPPIVYNNRDDVLRSKFLKNLSFFPFYSFSGRKLRLLTPQDGGL
jgi:hypothetical protein